MKMMNDMQNRFFYACLGAVEHVTVLIGISAFGKAVAGVINQPFYQTDGRTMWGVANLGAFGVVQEKRTTDQCIITTTKSHLTQLVTDTIDAMKPDLLLRTGGCGYKVLQVIEGTFGNIPSGYVVFIESV